MSRTATVVGPELRCGDTFAILLVAMGLEQLDELWRETDEPAPRPGFRLGRLRSFGDPLRAVTAVLPPAGPVAAVPPART